MKWPDKPAFPADTAWATVRSASHAGMINGWRYVTRRAGCTLIRVLFS